MRMFRLILLTLDDRKKCFPIAIAHALTAFPCSLIPFKIGELLRLAAFDQVFDRRVKAIAVWLAERVGDMLILSLFLLSLYWFNVKVPPSVIGICIVFVLVCGVCIGGSIAILKTFNYLNRHLVLNSLTGRSLALLHTGHNLNLIENSIRKSLEGRVIGFLLISIIIWALEIFALSLFINDISVVRHDFAGIFADGLLASLINTDSNGFAAYRSAALVTLTIACFLLLRLAKFPKDERN